MIGTGHVMRCLTLADELRDEGGAEVLFLCRPLEGNLIALIAARGHRVMTLPALGSHVPSSTRPTDWLGTDQATDAADCQRALASQAIFDWLIVDHYALDHEWETQMRPLCDRLLVVDDLADRSHDCDLLLDTGLGRTDADYRALIPDHALSLLGPRYALLRPEFRAHRAISLSRRDAPVLKQVLVTLGGTDPANMTCQALDALDATALPLETEISVVMGASAPWLSDVRRRASTMKQSTRVAVDVKNMAEIMTDSDLAIGAAGGTAWERCCLGLPSIQLVLAENQRGIGQSLQASGAAVSVVSPSEITDFLTELTARNELHSWMKQSAAAAAAIVTGNGVSAVRSSMMAHNA